MELITGITLAILVVFLVFLLFAEAVQLGGRIQKRQEREAAEASRRAFQDVKNRRDITACDLAGGVFQVPSPVRLHKNERAVFVAHDVSLVDLRSVRHGVGRGISVRVAKGVSLHAGGGQSEYSDEWRMVSVGTLVVTDKRVIFDGDRINKSFSFDKILSFSGGDDYLEVSPEGKSTKTFRFLFDRGPFARHLVERLVDGDENFKIYSNDTGSTDVAPPWMEIPFKKTLICANCGAEIEGDIAFSGEYACPACRCRLSTETAFDHELAMFNAAQNCYDESCARQLNQS